MTRIFTALTALVLGLSLVASTPASGGDAGAGPLPIVLPWGLGQLLPADPVAVAAIRSIDGLDAELRQLVTRFSPAQADSFDLMRLLSGPLAGLENVVDRTRPLAVALGMPSLGGPPPVTFLVPLADPSWTVDDLTQRAQRPPAAVKQGYAAYSTDPAYAPAGELPAVARDLPRGDLTVRFDLKTLLATYRPMINMMLQGALMAGASPHGGGTGADARGDSTGGSPPGLTPEARQAALDAVGQVLGSLASIELGFSPGGEQVELSAGIGFVENSALAPGPQPDFAQALKLAELLPADAPVQEAVALDPSPWLELFTKLQALSRLEPQAADKPQSARLEAAYREWVERYLRTPGLSSGTYASSLGVGAEGISFTTILRAEKSKQALSDLADLFLSMNGVVPGMKVQEEAKQKIAGLEVRTLNLQLEPDSLVAFAGSDSAEAAAATQLQMVAAFLPTMHLAASGDLVALVGSNDAEALRTAMERLKSGKGSPKAGLQQAAAWAGKGAQSVVYVDAAGLLKSASQLLGGLMGSAPSVEDEAPVPLLMAVVVDGPRMTTRVRVDGAGIARIGALLKAWSQAFGAAATTPDSSRSELDSPEASEDIASMSVDQARALAEEVMPKVEALRGLKFKHTVPVEVVDDATARAHFAERLKSMMPPDEIAHQQALYLDLGLLSPGVDLQQSLFEMLEEQAGGYYDPQKETFYLLDDMPAAAAPILMAHELTHALDDQYYNIDGMLEKATPEGDRGDAVGAVVEGSGTLVMSHFMAQEMMAGRLDQQALSAFQESEAGQAEHFKSAPQVLQRSLLGPYVLGQRFLLRGDMSRMMAKIDPEDIDHAFEDPPVSTEQILHPAKYWDADQRDDPIPLRLPDLTQTLGSGWTEADRGTLGEAVLAMLTGMPDLKIDDPMSMMGESWTNAAASGWGGDQWVLLVKEGASVTVLATLWDSVDDAHEFSDAVTPPQGATLRREGSAVVLVAGAPDGRGEKLAEVVLDSLARS